MIIGLPVVGRPELTNVALDNLTRHATNSKTRAVVIDNASNQEYFKNDFTDGFNGRTVDLIGNTENLGFYQPLKQLYDLYKNEQYIGIMHNDLILHTSGWDDILLKKFEEDPELGLIGLCGSREVDERGGRGGQTVCNFLGLDVQVGDNVWKGQAPGAGRRLPVGGHEPAIVLDSLFMLFRRDVIPHLVAAAEKWEDITLAHFYDRIWPIRTIEAGYHVITAGIDCDHIGGMTTTANERYRDDCIKFLDDRDIKWRVEEGDAVPQPFDAKNTASGNPETQMYLTAESRFLKEYRDEKHWLPAMIREGYHVTHLA